MIPELKLVSSDYLQLCCFVLGKLAGFLVGRVELGPPVLGAVPVDVGCKTVIWNIWNTGRNKYSLEVTQHNFRKTPRCWSRGIQVQPGPPTVAPSPGAERLLQR